MVLFRDPLLALKENLCSLVDIAYSLKHKILNTLHSYLNKVGSKHLNCFVRIEYLARYLQIYDQFLSLHGLFFIFN